MNSQVLARATGRWRELKAGLGTAAVAAGTTVVLTALAGTGFGWIHALGTPASPSNWSLTSALARLTARVLDLIGVGVAAAVLIALPLFAPTANFFACLVGGAVGGLAGLAATTLHHRE